jgi:DMSO/TMAO reductase YedYZ molybdopterin-dependent catalytic subunit
MKITRAGYFLQIPTLAVHALTSFITQEQDLFLLTHMALMAVDPLEWKLEVSGLVKQARHFTLADLHSIPQHEVISVHECAGSPLTPTVPKRRIGNMVLTGVRLADVLAQRN